jgi:hypothetical protein
MATTDFQTKGGRVADGESSSPSAALAPSRTIQIQIIMKLPLNQKRREQTATVINSRSAQLRFGARHFSNRYERRKVRGQLRHADWVLDLEN